MTQRQSIAQHACKKNYAVLTDSVHEVMEGELLGDGCVIRHHNSQFSACYQHGSKHGMYLRWLQSLFNSSGIECGKIYSRSDGTYLFRTFSYDVLLPLRNAFYPNGKKIVPQELVLTPIKALHWYLGDGSLAQSSSSKNSHIELATCSFCLESLAVLIKELLSNGIHARIHSRNRLYIGTKDTPKFLKWIGPCPNEIEEIYGYKWDRSHPSKIYSYGGLSHA